MTTFEIIQLFIGSGGLIGVIFIFFKMGKTAQKIESSDDKVSQQIASLDAKFTQKFEHLDAKFTQKFEHLDNSMIEYKKMTQHEFDSLKENIKDMQRSISKIEIQIGKLEIRVEERTLRVVQAAYEREPAVR